VRAPGIKGLEGRRVGIWGTGREGRAIARLALEHGASVTIVQDAPATGVSPTEIRVGSTGLRIQDPAVLDAEPLDLVVRSPGVSRYRAELERLRARGVDVTTPTAIWFEDNASRRVIGVTGSKGKTMTACLTALALESNGLSVGLGGNIGSPVTDFYDGPDKDAYVIEVSSFQAAEVTMSPPVGILTLLSPDHLDWHGTYERYVADKLNLFTHREDLELAVNARCAEALSATAGITSPARRHLYGPEGEVQVAGDGISVAGESVSALATLGSAPPTALRGRHNLDNLCGAITASRLLTGRWPDFSSLAAAIRNMSPLPSRLETLACSGGLEFVDDALASNPAGTIAALEAFSGRRVALIAGGHDRGTDLRGLAQALDAFGEVTVVFLDDAGERLSRELQPLRGKVACLRARDVSEALELAVDALDGPDGPDGGGVDGADGGGVVLFSPAAPTPPSMGTYVERSAEFRRAVRQHVDMRGDGDSAAC
jgi:UDP-N-acetylmuramoylalanine--D-glutamate ligase